MARWNNTALTSEEISRFKRDVVLRESGRLFNRNGYHNTSLDDIALALGVSKGTLYNYVTDKQEILFAFHNMGMDIGERAIAAARDIKENGLGKIRFAVVTYIRDVGEELGGYGVVAEIGALKTAEREKIVKRRDALDRSFTALIEEGMADGSLRRVDPKMALFTFLGVFQIIPNWFSPDGRLSSSEVADAIADVLLYGMAGPSVSEDAIEQKAQPVSSRKRRRSPKAAPS